MRFYDAFPAYVPVAEKLRRGRAALKRSLKRPPRPVTIEGRRGIAQTFWGRAWCENLERYSDYESRLPRGRTYARNGSILDLAIEPGAVKAYVAGSELYTVDIEIARLAAPRWKGVVKACAGRIGSIVALLGGELSDDVMSILTDGDRGLFPEPDEITLDCSCPDGATMCKHVAATLYGVGVRLDEEPATFFTLRRVAAEDLFTATPDLRRQPTKRKTVAPSALESVFGIELAAPPRRSRRPRP
jgi:uncharacterized Zn finger protein